MTDVTAAEASSFDRAIGLAKDVGFRSELSALRAKATLKELLGQPPEYNWPDSPERTIRNATALHLAVRTEAEQRPDLAADLRAAARISAQAWESIAGLEELSHRSTALINAAVGYELAGYQANASCLARLSASTASWSVEPTFAGMVAAFLQRLFLRIVTTSPELLHEPDVDVLESREQLLRKMSSALGVRGIADASRYFLSGNEDHLSSADEALMMAVDGFVAVGDIHQVNLASNLRALLPFMRERSTWKVLEDVVPGNLRWRRYLQVLARGLSPSVLDSRSISELWPSQLSAISGGLLDPDANKIVRMPTSAGKTRVAELAIVHALVTRPRSRCLYVAPFRALVNEIDQSFASLFVDLGYSASALLGNYEDDVLDNVTASDDQVLVLTPEKLDLVLRVAPEALTDTELIILDEGHIVGDQARGARYELLVTRLRRLLPKARVILLSAVVAQETLEDFAGWLHAQESDVLQTDWRPSIQRLARLDWNGTSGVLRYDAGDEDAVLASFVPNLVRQRTFEYVHPDTHRRRRPVFPETDNKGQLAAALAYELVRQGPALIFCAQTDWALSVGRALATRVELGERTGEETPGVFRQLDTPRSFVVAEEWLGPEDPTTQLLRLGIGVHHGRLPEAVRNAIEEDFRRKRLGVLCATSTLAQGVNLPVRTVIVHSVWRYDEAKDARTRLEAREYWNIAGRAGRAGEETEGTIIHIVRTSQDVADYRYYLEHRSAVEPVTSALFELLRGLVEQRITSDDAVALLDAELLALLVEEGAENLDLTAVRSIVEETLGGTQARRRGIDRGEFSDALTAGIREIEQRIPDEGRRRIFASTGLSSGSCEILLAHVRDRRAALPALLANGSYDDVPEILAVLLQGLSRLDQMQPRSSYSGSHPDLLEFWMSGRPVGDAVREFAGDGEDVSRFIEEYFAYLLPWGISSYLRIATYELELDVLSPVVLGLASLVKYGVPTLQASWAMSAGVANRRTAILLAGLYSSDNPEPDAREFRRWLADLNPEELVEEYGVPESALADVSKAMLRTGQSEHLDRLDDGLPILPMTTVVNVFRRAQSLISPLVPGAALSLRRDFDSPYRNAISLHAQGQTLGYLRRTDAQAVAPELDSGIAIDAALISTEVAESGRTRAEVRLTVAS